MSIKVYVTNDFNHMSKAAAKIALECITKTLETKKAWELNIYSSG